MRFIPALPVMAFLLFSSALSAQQLYELNSGWTCAKMGDVPLQGKTISVPGTPLPGWKPAVVPGTVLTTLLANKEIPDPFYGMNNERIADIYTSGKEQYTYWFVNNFRASAAGKQVWLHLRGVNYGCDVYLNGRQLNTKTHKGMFLRQRYNITAFLQKDGNNRLAVIVYPPDAPGNANGGQGGDGTIARNVSLQYAAGWDWIQPVRDRNTGIWDKVFIETTGQVNILNPHIITLVPGKRLPEGKQQPAVIKVSAELENTSPQAVTGILSYLLEGITVQIKVRLAALSTR